MKSHRLIALDEEIYRKPSVDCVAWLLVGKIIRSMMNRSNLNKDKYKMFSFSQSRAQVKIFFKK